MPEFEDTNPNQNTAPETYTPSTDATAKPRTRRRSGGFKKELAPDNSGKMGEVSAAEALKQERLSGSAKAASANEAPPVREKRVRETPREGPRARREPETEASSADTKPTRAPRVRTERASSAPDEPRRTPEPSEATLAAIQRIEASIEARRAERDARRKERPDKRDRATPGERSERSERKPKERPTAAKRTAPRSSDHPKSGGLLGAISGFFGNLFGGSQPTTKSIGEREGNLEDVRARSGNRRSNDTRRPNQNRGKGGRPSGGNRGRGGQGRRSGGGSGSGRRQPSEARSDS